MKTIEERAIDSASHSYIEDGDIRTYVNQSEKEYYIKGATEQKDIENERYVEFMRQMISEMTNDLASQRKHIIDKACEWLKMHLAEWSQFDDKDIEAFRKAMEE